MTDQMIAWQVEEWIRDYEFILREIDRLTRLLNRAEFAGGQSSRQHTVMKLQCLKDQQE